MIVCEVASRRIARLKPRIRHISQEVLQTKWDPISDAPRGDILELLKAVGKPVIAGATSEKTRPAVQDTVGSLLKTSVTRFSNAASLPPPSDITLQPEQTSLQGTVSAGHEARPISARGQSGRQRTWNVIMGVLLHLIVAQIGIEAQLTGAMHAVALLKADIHREERLLDAELNNFQLLETNARREESLRTRHARHVSNIQTGMTLASVDTLQGPYLASTRSRIYQAP